MSTSFDPYYKWLGIPREEQPPHLYRLLGLQPFEADPDVIGNAADQRMGLLKTFATGNYSLLSETLLNEVARARVWLLNSEKKIAYDRKLREMFGASASNADNRQALEVAFVAMPTVLEVVPTSNSSLARNVVDSAPVPQSRNAAPVLENESNFDAYFDPRVPVTGIVSRHRTKPRPFILAMLFKACLAGAIGLLAGYFVLCLIDIQYDFLHLLAVDKSASQPESPTVEPVAPLFRPSLPTAPQPPKTTAPKMPRGPRIPNNNAPPINPPVEDPPRDERVPDAPDPFADLPQRLPIPVPEVLHSPASLFAVPLEQLNNFELALLNFGEDGLNQLSLARLGDGEGESRWRWAVKLMGNAERDIATFSIVKNELMFEWSAEPSQPNVAALRNSILKIRAAGREHFTALRAPLLTGPLTFDLDKAVDRAACNCIDLPDVNIMRVDILEFENCPNYKIEGHGLLGLKYNDETTLRYAEADGALTKFKFVTFKNLPALEIEYRYQLPSGDSDSMNFTRGKRKLVKLQRALAVRDDPVMRKDMESLKHVGEIAESLHEKVKMHFRFYFVIDQHEVELATTVIE